MLFWTGAVLSGFLGYKLLDWWVPAVIACVVVAGQFVLFHTVLGGPASGAELLMFSLLLNLAMYYAMFSIGRAIGERLKQRKRSVR